jgi:hypothetical protein
LFRRHGGWKRARAVFKYADVLLGSLLFVVPWFDPVKELKEGTETSIEVVYPEGSD